MTQSFYTGENAVEKNFFKTIFKINRRMWCSCLFSMISIVSANGVLLVFIRVKPNGV